MRTPRSFHGSVSPKEQIPDTYHRLGPQRFGDSYRRSRSPSRVTLSYLSKVLPMRNAEIFRVRDMLTTRSLAMDRRCPFAPAVFLIGLTAFATLTYAQTKRRALCGSPEIADAPRLC